MSDIAAEFTVAAIKSGNLSTEPEQIVNFYFQLLALIKERYKEEQNATKSNSSRVHVFSGH